MQKRAKMWWKILYEFCWEFNLLFSGEKILKKINIKQVRTD